MTQREQMNVVVVGHVDHGKSTVIGRLLADTGSLPEGKLDQVREQCKRNARPFEYAFLLDALKDEQAQGITIDTARCFFKTAKRDYIIIDAPGHVEFLKNMVSGAARAEAALLVIDAHEGIAENSRRHGYLVAMLGIRRIIVLVNKMDLVRYDQETFATVTSSYSSFLRRLDVEPLAYIPVCARNGDNLAAPSTAMPWYTGDTVLDLVDQLEQKPDDSHKPFRMPVQDIYKFTENGDERRILAGTVETGTLSVGDTVLFHPSGKRSEVVSIEGFNRAATATVSSGHATGVTLKDELYLKRGEIMCKADEPQPLVASRFVASVFWMGTAPLIRGKRYKLKTGTAAVPVHLVDIIASIDATDLSSVAGKRQLDRHDVAECVFETLKPVAFDPVTEIESTGRFVIVDNYDIAGGGIIFRADSSEQTWIGDHVRRREITWDSGYVTPDQRISRNGHSPKCIIIRGDRRRTETARILERSLFTAGFQSYYLGIESVRTGLEADLPPDSDTGEQLIRHIGELSRIVTDAGLIFISAIGDTDAEDIAIIRKLNEPASVLVVTLSSDTAIPEEGDVVLSPEFDAEGCASAIIGRLRRETILPDYSI